MTLPSSPPITLLEISKEFCGAANNLLSFYAGDGIILSGAANGTGAAIPTSGPLSPLDFLGMTSLVKPMANSPPGFSGTSSDFYSIAYANGIFVAVAAYGGVAYSSPDGNTWTQSLSNTTLGLGGVQAVNNHFVAYGSYGYYAWSNTGLSGSWNNQRITVGSGATNSINYNPAGIVCANGVYVMAVTPSYVNAAPQIFTSNTLATSTWTAHSVTGYTSTQFIAPSINAITYSGSEYLILGIDGSNNSVMALTAPASSNGATWSAANISAQMTGGIPSQIFAGATTDNTNFYFSCGNTANAFYSSSNGTSWTFNTGITGYYSINNNNPGPQYIGNVYFSTYGNNISYNTTNPVTGVWRNIPIANCAAVTSCIAQGNNQSVVMGYNSFYSETGSFFTHN